MLQGLGNSASAESEHFIAQPGIQHELIRVKLGTDVQKVFEVLAMGIRYGSGIMNILAPMRPSGKSGTHCEVEFRFKKCTVRIPFHAQTLQETRSATG